MVTSQSMMSESHWKNSNVVDTFETVTLSLGPKLLKIRELWMIKITRQMSPIFIFCVDLDLVCIFVW